MLWFVAGVALVILAFYYKWARYLLGVIIAACLIVTAWLYKTEENSRREREAAKRLIPPAQVHLEELELSRSGASFSLNGKIRNTSPKYTITSLELNLTVRDCSKSPCDVVGETVQQIFVRVPPNQVRELNESAYISDVPTFKGSWDWNYSIKSVSAESR